MKTLTGAPKKSFTAQEFNNHLSEIFNRSSDTKPLPIQVQYGFKCKGIDLKDYKLVGYVKGDKINKPENMSYLQFDCLQFSKFDTNTIDGRCFMHVNGFINKREYLLIFKKCTQK